MSKRPRLCPAENENVPEHQIDRADFNELAEKLLEENNPDCPDIAALQRALLSQIAYNDDFVEKKRPDAPSPMSFISRIKSRICKYLPTKTRKWCLGKVHKKQQQQEEYDKHVQEMAHFTAMHHKISPHKTKL